MIQRRAFLLASAALVAMVSGQKSRTPEATLEAIEATVGRDDFNHEAILRSLDGALSNARATGDTELQAKALTLRGDVLYKIGAYEDSIRDFDEVSARLRGPAGSTVALEVLQPRSLYSLLHVFLTLQRRLLEDGCEEDYHWWQDDGDDEPDTWSEDDGDAVDGLDLDSESEDSLGEEDEDEDDESEEPAQASKRQRR